MLLYLAVLCAYIETQNLYVTLGLITKTSYVLSQDYLKLHVDHTSIVSCRLLSTITYDLSYSYHKLINYKVLSYDILTLL